MAKREFPSLLPRAKDDYVRMMQAKAADLNSLPGISITIPSNHVGFINAMDLFETAIEDTLDNVDVFLRLYGNMPVERNPDQMLGGVRAGAVAEILNDLNAIRVWWAELTSGILPSVFGQRTSFSNGVVPDIKRTVNQKAMQEMVLQKQLDKRVDMEMKVWEHVTSATSSYPMGVVKDYGQIGFPRGMVTMNSDGGLLIVKSSTYDSESGEGTFVLAFPNTVGVVNYIVTLPLIVPEGCYSPIHYEVYDTEAGVLTTEIYSMVDQEGTMRKCQGIVGASSPGDNATYHFSVQNTLLWAGSDVTVSYTLKTNRRFVNPHRVSENIDGITLSLRDAADISSSVGLICDLIRVYDENSDGGYDHTFKQQVYNILSAGTNVLIGDIFVPDGQLYNLVAILTNEFTFVNTNTSLIVTINNNVRKKLLAAYYKFGKIAASSQTSFEAIESLIL